MPWLLSRTDRRRVWSSSVSSWLPSPPPSRPSTTMSPSDRVSSSAWLLLARESGPILRTKTLRSPGLSDKLLRSWRRSLSKTSSTSLRAGRTKPTKPATLILMTLPSPRLTTLAPTATPTPLLTTTLKIASGTLPSLNSSRRMVVRSATQSLTTKRSTMSGRR